MTEGGAYRKNVMLIRHASREASALTWDNFTLERRLYTDGESGRWRKTMLSKYLRLMLRKEEVKMIRHRPAEAMIREAMETTKRGAERYMSEITRITGLYLEVSILIFSSWEASHASDISSNSIIDSNTASSAFLIPSRSDRQGQAVEKRRESWRKKAYVLPRPTGPRYRSALVIS